MNDDNYTLPEGFLKRETIKELVQEVVKKALKNIEDMEVIDNYFVSYLFLMHQNLEQTKYYFNMIEKINKRLLTAINKLNRNVEKINKAVDTNQTLLNIQTMLENHIFKNKFNNKEEA